MISKMPAKMAIRGILKVRVVEGVDLARCDVWSLSDPYVILSVGSKSVRTRTKKNCQNPRWDEELTLATSDPPEPLKLFVYDHDTFSCDDKMGNAEIDLNSLVTAVKCKESLNCQDGMIIRKIPATRQNCFAEESLLEIRKGRLVQHVCVMLQNVERGKIKLEFMWQPYPQSQ